MNPRSRNKIRFDNVVYAPGYLEAVAYRAGKAVARHRIETTGEAKRLQLTPDAIQWQADGTDLMHVRVYAVDGKGRRVWSAQDELIFSVEGDARIVAVDNGNIYSHELH
jgi:beta-galactosidase